MIDVSLIDDLSALEQLTPEWDALAVAAAMPMSAPAWMLAWWRHQRPPGGRLSAVAVREGKRLIGLAPLYATPGRRGAPQTLRLLAADFSTSVSPLALPGREWTVAGAIDRALAHMRPRPAALALAPMRLASPWPLALRERWPGPLQPPVFRYDLQSAPVVTLSGGSFDSWLAGRSSKFRASMRRSERLFADAGGSMRLSTAQTLREDVQAFARLHAMRWEGRGHSRLAALGERLTQTLLEAGAALAPSRFRLRVMEVGGEPICADISIAAGGEVLGFNTGWDERFKRISPALLAFLYKIRDGFEHGDRRVQLGWGGHSYKLRFADGDDPVAWGTLLVPGRGLPLALARAAPLLGSAWIRASGKRLLSPAQIDRVRPLARLMPR
jgi:CelD/BcsL family acetyltransferase involved in cellulose biosynthesis